jgi:hypothetical protein
MERLSALYALAFFQQPYQIVTIRTLHFKMELTEAKRVAGTYLRQPDSFNFKSQRWDLVQVV